MFGGYLVLLGLTAIPSVQQWLANFAADMIAERIHTRVSIRRIRVGLPGRLIVDGLQVYDRRDSLMLHVPRVAAKVDITPLVDKQICINNAQLFGARATLYHAVPDSAPNWQFLIDAFSNPDDTTSSAINLRIGSLLVRRCQIRYDRLYEPHSADKLDKNHLKITNLSVTARLGRLTPDSLNITLNKFACHEQSGFELNKMKFKVVGNRDSLHLTGLDIQLPHSSLSIPLLTASYPGMPKKGRPIADWLDCIKVNTSIDLKAMPTDLFALVPNLRHMDEPLSLSSNIQLSEKGKLSFSGLHLSEGDEQLTLFANIQAEDIFRKPKANVHILDLSNKRELWAHLPELFPTLKASLTKRLQRLGSTRTNGTIYYSQDLVRTDMDIHTEVGKAHLKGTLSEKNHLAADIQLEGARLDEFINKPSPQPANLSATIALKGELKGTENRPSMHASGLIQSLTFQQHTYHNIPFNASAHGYDYQLGLQVNEEQGQATLEAQAYMPPFGTKNVNISGNLAQFNPSALHLTKALADESITGEIQAHIALPASGQPEGDIQLTGLSMSAPEKGLLDIGDIDISCHSDSGFQRVKLQSDFALLEATGTFKWKFIPQSIQKLTHRHLPSLITVPRTLSESEEVDLDFNLRVRDTSVIKRLTGTGISIPEEAVLNGYIHSGVSLLEIDGQIPQLILGNEEFRNTNLRMECTERNVQASMRAQRLMKGKPVDVDMAAYTENDRLSAQITWDNNTQPLHKGALSVATNFRKEPDGKTAISARLNPTEVIISDTVWHIHPGSIHWHQGMADINDISLSNNDRYLALNGKISAQETDTLTVDVKDFDLSYLFNLVNFHSVDFRGYATGRVYGQTLLGTPKADAFLQVHDFTFNDAQMGNMDVHVNWGALPKTIQLNAYIQDAPERQQTTVTGRITPGHAPGSGLDLDIHTQRMDLSFLHRYASSIFSKMEGRITGNCRIFGPFKGINLRGEAVAEEASVRVASLGVDYHLAGDSVILVPDTIRFPGATIYDYLGNPGYTEHAARIKGELTHHNLKRMCYDVHVDAQNILGYNFPQMEDLSFCGTVFATGTAHVYGKPGSVNIDVKATPQSGTTLVYDASSPTTVTDAHFITYVSHADSVSQEAKIEEKEEETSSSDMRLNFNLDITPEATMQVLMDTKSGDYINLYGNGRILANYYNKGKFQMYGTYRVDHGVYKLSLQDVIRKDFTFRSNGTITFGGNPGKAALQLTAVYTVPNVSLDDLSSSSLGLSNTRVDCVMNIGGEAFTPMISFDFDLPNANEDEKRMVRSMLSTEEEKNMQVIYLLGIGRFYNQNTQFQNAGSQSGTAMNSLISSTLSSQFNQFLSNAMGSHNWSFGANLRTGETGWDQLDIEGILSGRLLNNRLLINGNFGYRESYYSTNNFIGDFDVQYLLTPNGNLSLKAYNQTNDRYFIQSSLTTQGIGLQYKRDFNNWRQAFRRTRKVKDGKVNNNTAKGDK